MVHSFCSSGEERLKFRSFLCRLFLAVENQEEDGKKCICWSCLSHVTSSDGKREREKQNEGIRGKASERSDGGGEEKGSFPRRDKVVHCSSRRSDVNSNDRWLGDVGVAQRIGQIEMDLLIIIVEQLVVFIVDGQVKLEFNGIGQTKRKEFPHQRFQLGDADRRWDLLLHFLFVLQLEANEKESRTNAKAFLHLLNKRTENDSDSDETRTRNERNN